MKKQLHLFLLIFLFFIQKIGYAEETLYANSFEGNSELYIINSSTGSTEIIGTIGFRVTDVAFYDSELYGITSSSFLKINESTGIGTEIGDLNFDDMFALAVSDSGEVFAASGSTGNLINIDVNTGNGTLIGNYGNGLTSSGDLAFDSSGNLYASVLIPGSSTDWLAQVNTLTGEADLIGDIGFSEVWGLSFIDNSLYGVTSSGKLILINKITGESSEIGESQNIHGGLATLIENCPEILNTGTVTSNLDIHLPFINYESLQGTQNIWANLKYLGTNIEEQHIWELKDFGVNQSENCSETFSIGTVSSILDIFMPSLNYESLQGTKNIRANLKYLGTNSEEQHIWTLKDFGVN